MSDALGSRIEAMVAAILEIYRTHSAGTKLRVALSEFLDEQGDREDSSFDALIGAASSEPAGSAGSRLSSAMAAVTIVADAANSAWERELHYDVMRTPVRTVVGFAVLRLMIQTELLIKQLADQGDAKHSDLRSMAGNQTHVWLFG